MSPLGDVAADVVVGSVTVAEDDMAADVVVSAGSDVVAGPVLRVLPTPVVLMELTEPVELMDVIWVVVMTVVVWEVISSEEFSEESLEAHFISHNHFCSKYLKSLLGPTKRWPLPHCEWKINRMTSDLQLQCHYITAVQDPILATTHISDSSDPGIFSPLDDSTNHENVPEINKK